MTRGCDVGLVDASPSSCDPDEEKGFSTRRAGWNRGDTICIEWDLVDRFEAPVDLSQPGCKAWFTIKDYLTKADSQALWQGTMSSGIVQESRGKYVVTVPPSATYLLPDGVDKLFYDFQVKDASGAISTIEKGLIVLSPDVTKAIA